jgi:hypothetical protein
MPSARRIFLAAVIALTALGLPALAAAQSNLENDAESVARHSRALLFGTDAEFREAVDFIRKRGKPDAAAALILALRYRSDRASQLSAALTAITSHHATDWFDWMLWQETNAQIEPHASFTALTLDVLSRIDPGFLVFFRDPWVQRRRMKIRLEEIAWGGVGALTGIRSLDSPAMIAADAAGYLLDSDLVFGVAINGDARAFPLRIMGWHEMMNDLIGGVPVALAYCTLCGSGILFETQVEGREKPFIFGSSGLLYRSNKLMFDWETKSLWNQFTGRPVVGPLVDSGIALRERPIVITSWEHWRAQNPRTMVLSLETGYTRDYGSGVVYREYFTSPDLMFPAVVREGTSLQQKDYVYGIRDVGVAKAWPLAAFGGGAVINDNLGARPVVLVGNATTRTVRAYERGAHSFSWSGSEDQLAGPNGPWQVQEDALVGPDGTRLPRIPGSVSYWFAWDGYLGVKSELYSPGATAQ